MKAFRGTFIALIALIAVGVVYVFFGPGPRTTGGGDEECDQLFDFEKHELTSVRIQQPDSDGGRLIEFAEQDDGEWYLLDEEGDEQVDRSMVNRVKHQIHDLCIRADVQDPDKLEKYGLGNLAAQIQLTLRGDKMVEFDVGDPNPTGVSYYIQKDGDGTVYTVKKSASDFWFSELRAFRNPKFARFDSKDATRIHAILKTEDVDRTLTLELLDEEWEMRSPMQMSAHNQDVRRLLGRVQALKAREYIDFTPEEAAATMAKYGLDAPRADVTIAFGNRDPIHLFIGKAAPSTSRYEENLAYMTLEGDDTIYVSKAGMLEDFTGDPEGLRNRRVVRMKVEDVVAVDVEVFETEDDDLTGTASVRYASGGWLWDDGVPVPGSSPERLARQLAEMEVDALITDNVEDPAEYGLDNPDATAVLTDREDNQRIMAIGGLGEPEEDPEGNPILRRYIQIEGDPYVYLVSARSLDSIKDLIRQRNRKAKKDEERARSRELIRSEAPELFEDEMAPPPPPPEDNAPAPAPAPGPKAPQEN
ncbi:MAG: DUF4340 domain-containing protein [Myxococcota bacterium]